MDPRSQIRQAIAEMPVSWLHMPSLASAVALRKDASPKNPLLIAAIGGVLTGGGLAVGGVAMTRPKGAEPDAAGIVCNLTLQEIEDGAVKLYEASLAGTDGGALQQVADAAAPAGAKNPLVLAFLGGVGAGAGAVAVGARAGQGKP